MKRVELNEKDTFSLLLTAIYASERDPSYRFVADMLQLLDEEDFKNFFALYEGQTIKIPSISMLTKMLQALSMYAYHDMEGEDLKTTAKFCGYTGVYEETQKLSPEYYKLKKLLNRKRLNIGGETGEIPAANSFDIS